MGAASSEPVADLDLDGVEPWAADAKRAVRWACNIGSWTPTDAEWAFLTALLPSKECRRVERFIRPMDKKRALLSRLMQRRCVAHALEHPDAAVLIARTKGDKPYDATPRASACTAAAPNFNFNVSHEGSWVVLASEPALLVGVDVSAPFHLRGGPTIASDFTQLRERFDSVLSPDEWEAIEAADGEAERVKGFRRQWSRKESLVKARGDGLAFALAKARFYPCHSPQPPPSMPVDFVPEESEAAAAPAAAPLLAPAAAPLLDGDGLAGSELRGVGPPIFSLLHLDDDSWLGWTDEPSNVWRCCTHELTDGHIISVTRGSVGEVIDAHGAFIATLQRPHMPEGEFRARLAAPPPPLRELSVRDLVPPPMRDAYDAVVRGERPSMPAYTPAEPPEPPWREDEPPSAADPAKLPAWFNMQNASGGQDEIDPIFGGSTRPRTSTEEDCAIM